MKLSILLTLLLSTPGLQKHEVLINAVAAAIARTATAEHEALSRVALPDLMIVERRLQC